MSKMSAQKRLLEKSRQEKQAAKRERRHTRPGDEAGVDEGAASQEPKQEFDQAELLAQLAELHRRYADGQVSLDDFENTRDTLVQRLRVD